MKFVIEHRIVESSEGFSRSETSKRTVEINDGNRGEFLTKIQAITSDPGLQFLTVRRVPTPVPKKITLHPQGGK